MAYILIDSNDDWVLQIDNKNTGDIRDKLLLTSNTVLSGMPFLKKNIVHIGYNERVQCDSIESAEILFNKIIEIY